MSKYFNSIKLRRFFRRFSVAILSLFAISSVPVEAASSKKQTPADRQHHKLVHKTAPKKKTPPAKVRAKKTVIPIKKALASVVKKAVVPIKKTLAPKVAPKKVPGSVTKKATVPLKETPPIKVKTRKVSSPVAPKAMVQQTPTPVATKKVPGPVTKKATVPLKETLPVKIKARKVSSPVAPKAMVKQTPTPIASKKAPIHKVVPNTRALGLGESQRAEKLQPLDAEERQLREELRELFERQMRNPSVVIADFDERFSKIVPRLEEIGRKKDGFLKKPERLAAEKVRLQEATAASIRQKEIKTWQQQAEHARQQQAERARVQQLEQARLQKAELARQQAEITRQQQVEQTRLQKAELARQQAEITRLQQVEQARQAAEQVRLQQQVTEEQDRQLTHLSEQLLEGVELMRQHKYDGLDGGWKKVFDVNQEAGNKGYRTASGKIVDPAIFRINEIQRNTVKWTHEHLQNVAQAEQFNLLRGQHQTIFRVTDQDSFVAAKELIDRGLNPTVSNAANAIIHGGAVAIGGQAQEEELCKRSTLYQGLLPELYPMQNNELIYTPDVTVFMQPNTYAFMDDPFFVPVITQAYLYLAPNLIEPEKEPAYQQITESKIRAHLRMARAMGHDSVVLAASGCGVFAGGRSGPVSEVVAGLYKKVFQDEFNGVFKEVRFAILRGGAINKAFSDEIDPLN